MLTRNISVGIWHLVCWAEDGSPLFRRDTLAMFLLHPTCHNELAVASSCKKRGSAHGVSRLMADSAVHLPPINLLV